MANITTERLYYTEPHLFTCTAKVVSCTPAEGGFEVVLDRTVLFPEGGGQPSDAGTLDSVPVISADDRGESIVYLVPEKFSVGQEVSVSIDVERRLDHSRQHTGEHMLSGILKRDFGASNVGFHMSADYSTIDIDEELTAEELSELEIRVNRAIMANEPVYIEIVEPDALDGITLRKDTTKLASGSEPVRIVYVGEDGSIDACACCGTHVAMTGEIGMLSITAVKRHRGGMRFWFLCGERALRDAVLRRSEAEKIANMFSTGVNEAAGSVKKLFDENASLRHALRTARGELAEIHAKELFAAADDVNGVRAIAAKICGDASDAKQLSDRIAAVYQTENKRGAAVVFASDSSRIYYTVCSTEKVTPDAAEICKAVNALVNGRGGGRGTFAQGSAQFSGELQLEDSLNALLQYLKNALK